MSIKKVGQIIRALKKDKVIAYPTDTAYGLGASVDSVKGIKKIFKIKGRQVKNPISIVVSSLREAKEIAVFNKKALELWRKHMPGPITLVLPLSIVLRGRWNWRLLSAGTGTIGIRMPDHKVSLELVKKLGVPITTTSANVSGKPSLYSVDDIKTQFGKRRTKPDIIINGGKLKKGNISTVVDCTGPEIKILRKGKIKNIK